MLLFRHHSKNLSSIAKEMLDPDSPFHAKTFRDVAKDENSFRKAKHKKKFWEMQND